MKINYLDNNPREIQLEEDLPPYMTEAVAMILLRYLVRH